MYPQLTTKISIYLRQRIIKNQRAQQVISIPEKVVSIHTINCRALVVLIGLNTYHIFLFAYLSFGYHLFVTAKNNTHCYIRTNSISHISQKPFEHIRSHVGISDSNPNGFDWLVFHGSGMINLFGVAQIKCDCLQIVKLQNLQSHQWGTFDKVSLQIALKQAMQLIVSVSCDIGIYTRKEVLSVGSLD